MTEMAGTTAAKPNDIFEEARRVFSASYVNLLRTKGHDFLEHEGKGSYTTDSENKRCLDGCTSSGTFNLGRRNEVIAEVFKKAIYETDQGNFVMPSDYKSLLARRLSQFVPGRLDCVLFGVTRGESMDAACKLARGSTSRPEFVTVGGGLYGETGFALSLSERPGKEPFGALVPGVKTVPFGDIGAAREAVTSRTAAFVMEPIQAENHCCTADPDFYRRIRALCDESGAKLIFDETQSGFGRTGKRFFFEHLGVEPDILIIGEAMTSGMFPMTAMVFTPELKHFFDMHPLIHLCTFGGHDLGCLVAMAALREYDRLSPWENAAMLGNRLINRLSDLAENSTSSVVSVAGKGLLISLKLATDDMAMKFSAAARQDGLLVNTGRVDATTALIRPSLLINEEEADRIVSITASIMETI